MILETPHIYSLWASASQFYLDPTHEYPVHPVFISFLAEDIGFSGIELLSFDEVDSSAAQEFKDRYGGGHAYKWLSGSKDVGMIIFIKCLTNGNL